MARVFDHTGKEVFSDKSCDSCILWMWRRIAQDIIDKVPIIGYTNDVVSAHEPIPVAKLEPHEIEALRSEGIL